jgi:hypothetical protein
MVSSSATQCPDKEHDRESSASVFVLPVDKGLLAAFHRVGDQLADIGLVYYSDAIELALSM